MRGISPEKHGDFSVAIVRRQRHVRALSARSTRTLAMLTFQFHSAAIMTLFQSPLSPVSDSIFANMRTRTREAYD